MIKSTHKTIQDYFRPAVGPSKRDTARTSRADSFQSVLQMAYKASEPPPAPKDRAETGLSVQDYMHRRLVAPVRQRPIQAPEGQKTVETALNKDDAASAAAKKPSPARAVDPIAAPSEHASIQQAILSAARKYDLPAGLIRSVIRCESNFQPDAVSHAGAQGLMQLMPATADDLGVANPFDIEQNIDGGSRYLRWMLDRFDGDIEKALAAYNAGPGTVSRYGGVPPYRETQAYVKKVMGLAGMPNTARVG